VRGGQQLCGGEAAVRAAVGVPVCAPTPSCSLHAAHVLARHATPALHTSPPPITSLPPCSKDMTLKEAEVLALSTLKQVMEEKVRQVAARQGHAPGVSCLC
jgi:hypothetical protein